MNPIWDKYAEAAARLPAFLNNVFRIEFGPDGRPRYRSTDPRNPTPVSTPREALEDAALGLKRRDIFDFTGGTSTRFRGPLFYNELEHVAKTQGIKLIRESWDATTDSVVTVSERLLDRGLGLTVPGKDDFTVLRGFGEDGQELSSTQLVRHLRNSGWEWYGEGGRLLSDTEIVQGVNYSEKTSKRLRALLSPRIYGTSSAFKGTRSGRMKVGVFDDLAGLQQHSAPMARALGREGAETVFDGISVINPRTLREIAKDMHSRARAIEAEFSGVQTKEAVDAINDAKAIRRNADSLIKAADTPGSRFNLRAMNFEVEAMGGGFSKKVLKALSKGQIKGDTLVGSAKDFSRGGRYYGKDLVIAASNITKEFGIGGGRTGSVVTLEPTSPKAGIARTDVQSLTAHSGAFRTAEMVKATKADMEGFMRNLDDTGELPFDYVQGLRETVRAGRPAPGMYPDISDDKIADMMRQYDEAKSILTYVDSGGDIRRAPHLISMILASKRKQLDRQKAGRTVPNLLIPDAVDAHVTNQITAEAALGRKLDVAKGALGFDPHVGWIMHPEDVIKYYASFGGFDQDDALRVMLQSVDDTGEFAGLAYRLPTTMGESATFKVDLQSSVWEFMLKNTGRGKEAAELRRLNKSLRRMGSANFMEAEDLTADQVTRMRNLALGRRRNLINSAILHTTKAQIDAFEVNAFHNLGEGESPHLAMRILARAEKEAGGAMSMQEQLRVLNETKHALGEYANTKMILDSVLNSDLLNQLDDEAMKKLGVAFKALENEEVLDAMTSGGAANEQMLGRIKQVRESLGYGTARAIWVAREAGLDTAEMGIDRALWEARGAMAQEDVLAGIQRLNDEVGASLELEDLLAPTGEYSRQLQASLDLIAEAEAAEAQYIAKYAYGDDIMLNLLDEDEALEVRRIMDAVRNTQDAFPAHFSDEVMGELIDGFGLHGLTEQVGIFDPSGTQQAEVAKTVRAAIAQTFDEETGYATKRTYDIISGLMQTSMEQSTMGSRARSVLLTPGLEPLLAETQLYFDSQGWTNFDALQTLRDRMGNTTEAVDYLKNGRITVGQLGDMTDALLDTRPRMLSEELDDLGRLLSVDLVTQKGGMATDKLTMISKRGIGNLLRDVPALRKGLVGAGALVLGSYAYQFAKHRDRSPEELQGPPFLPGGNFYSPPMDEEMAYLGGAPSGSSNPGVVYRVTARGALNRADFEAALQGITGSRVTGSYYDASDRGSMDEIIASNF